MTPDGARDVLHTRAAQAGVADVHRHRFRHTFAPVAFWEADRSGT